MRHGAHVNESCLTHTRTHSDCEVEVAALCPTTTAHLHPLLLLLQPFFQSGAHEPTGKLLDRVLQGHAVCCSWFWSVAVCCSGFWCVVAVCCSVLQCVAVFCSSVVCCSELQCAAVCCSVLQCVPMFRIQNKELFGGI